MSRIKKQIRNVLKDFQRQLPEPESGWFGDLKKVVRYVHDHPFENDLTVGKLRENVYSKTNVFSTDFSYWVGKPPKTYINDLRVEAGKLLLADERFRNVPIYTIAKELGFSGSGAFSFAFKKREGMTPHKWREKS